MVEQTNLAALHETAFHALRANILAAAQLDADTLDNVALELACDLEWYPFDQAKDPQSRRRVENGYEAFHAMMRDAFGHVEWQLYCDSAQGNLQHHQYYLAWAWTENERAHDCLCDNPTCLDAQSATRAGLIHSHNAQRACLHAVTIMLL